MTLHADEIQITANNRYSGNDRYSGMKSPDRFFHYSGRCLYYVKWLTLTVMPIDIFQCRRNQQSFWTAEARL